jgi:hypothetical protein
MSIAQPLNPDRKNETTAARRTGELTPSERAMRARIASYASWARTEDRSARTAPGNRALMSSFERQVDPNGELPEAERLKRADAAKKAHFSRMALKSAKARRRKRDASTEAMRKHLRAYP